MKAPELEAQFNKAADALAQTDFVSCLKRHFDTAEMARNILGIFEKMGLPVPQAQEEFLTGQGALVFLNKYGLVIRIEKADTRYIDNNPDRIDDDAWVLRPIASLETGKALIQIFPGYHQETKVENNEYLREKLAEHGIEYFDYKLSNAGRSPVRTARFPEGTPAVIDRNAVKRLSGNIKPAHESAEDQELMEGLERLYAPLREAFEAAWPDAEKMKSFWELCQSYVEQGKLSAGWNDPLSDEVMHEKCEYGDNSKIVKAENAAARYAERLEAVEQQALNSTVPAVLQSPRQPV